MQSPSGGVTYPSQLPDHIRLALSILAQEKYDPDSVKQWYEEVLFTQASAHPSLYDVHDDSSPLHSYPPNPPFVNFAQTVDNHDRTGRPGPPRQRKTLERNFRKYRRVEASSIEANSAVHGKIKRFGCPKCQSRFARQKEFKRHYKEICEREKLWKCPDCPKMFNRRERFKSHHRTSHQCLPTPQGDCPHEEEAYQHLEPKRAFGCGFCPQLFIGEDRHSAFLEHMTQHYNKGKTFDDWQATTVVRNLLTRPDVQPLWRDICTGSLDFPYNETQTLALDIHAVIEMLEQSAHVNELRDVLHELPHNVFGRSAEPSTLQLLAPDGHGSNQPGIEGFSHHQQSMSLRNIRLENSPTGLCGNLNNDPHNHTRLSSSGFMGTSSWDRATSVDPTSDAEIQDPMSSILDPVDSSLPQNIAQIGTSFAPYEIPYHTNMEDD